jgi:hypothetical protein
MFHWEMQEIKNTQWLSLMFEWRFAIVCFCLCIHFACFDGMVTTIIMVIITVPIALS